MITASLSVYEHKLTPQKVFPCDFGGRILAQYLYYLHFPNDYIYIHILETFWFVSRFGFKTAVPRCGGS